MRRARYWASILLFLGGIAASLAAETRQADLWPTYRHDETLAGRSGLKGGLAQAPSVRWSADLGAAMAPAEQVRLEDFNGDGHVELLRILSDRLICQDLRGKPLWEADGLVHPAITDIRDYAGDGGRGLLVSCSLSGKTTTYMINGRTGGKARLYAQENVFGGSSRTGRLLPGVPGRQLAVWWSTGAFGEGWLWSFENGPDRPTVRFKVHEEGMVYAPLFLFADMDGDGAPDMVMISHEQIWIYDLAGGRRKAHMSWGNAIRSYWSIDAALPLKPGELPTLLMINPHIPGVQAIAQDGKTAHRLWKQVVGPIEDQYQPDVRIVSGAPNPFMDIDGDGHIEIMATVTNERGDGKDRLVIFGADDGKRLFEAPGLAVLSVDDLDGDGAPEVLLKEGETLRMTDFRDGKFVDRWREKGVEPLLKPLPSEGELSLGASAHMEAIGRGNRKLWREDENTAADRFLMKFADGVFSCALEKNGSLKKLKPIARHEALGNLPQAGPADPYEWNGEKLTVMENGRPVVHYEMPRRRSSLPMPALVGELGGQVRVVARDYEGTLISLSATGGDKRVLVRQSPGFGKGNHVSPEPIGQICDVDGDGTNEAIALTTEGGDAIVAVDAEGKVKLRVPAIEGATEWVLGATGRLGPNPGDGRWVVARFRKQFDLWAVAAYDGKTGRPLWMRPNFPPSASEKHGGFFALHVPTAVYDFNGDGADDLLADCENAYGIISVKDNKDLATVDAITAAVPGHWGAYATPIVARILGEEKPQVLRSRAYGLMMLIGLEGRPIWHYGLTRDTTIRTQPGLADLAGDGRLETVAAQGDGLLRAFDAQPLKEKCPTCPGGEPLTEANRAARQRWTYPLEPPVSDFVAIDLDGDGKDELLCGAGDGKLYALKESGGACAVLWTVDLGRRVGSPIVADLEGDGKASILVPTEDGRLHCLAGAR